MMIEMMEGMTDMLEEMIVMDIETDLETSTDSKMNQDQGQVNHHMEELQEGPGHLLRALVDPHLQHKVLQCHLYQEPLLWL